MNNTLFNNRFKHGLAISALCLALLAASNTASAVDVRTAGKFELDSNALDQAAAGDDWSALVGSGMGGSVATSHIMADYASPDYNFTGGGSKDVLDIGAWRYNAAKMTPDKDNITNAYAAAYTVDGHLLFYFGADRLAVNGSAQLGFWFFKNEVGLAPLSGGSGKFIGVHSNDDVLVQVNFLNGGSTAEIGVFKWANGALVKLAENIVTSSSGVQEVCTPGGTACARTNVSGTTPSYWPYTAKSGAPSGTFPAQAFFEGGIDITALVGGDLCFSSFMAETRSSHPFDATLKDFVLGPLQTCSIDVSKTCTQTRATTDLEFATTGKLWASTYQASVINSGSGALPANTTYTVVDNAGSPGDPSDDISQSFTGALAAGASYEFPAQEFFTNENGALNSVTASAIFGTQELSAGPYSIECPTRDVVGALGVTKDCAETGVEYVAQGGVLVAKVNVKGQVCNSNPTGGLSLTITKLEDLIGPDPLNPSQTIQLSAGYTLAPGECRAYEHSYFPNSADGSLSPAGQTVFSDTVKAEGTNPRLSLPVKQASNAAHCATCPLPSP